MWPFTKSTSKTSDVKIEMSGEFLTINKLKFFGEYKLSPNGRYKIAWSDSDGKGTGGNRNKGKGRYILIENNSIILTGFAERPNDCKVANNGTFIINDWMFGEGLTGKFYVIDKEGKLIFEKKFKANLYNNGIAADGDYAVCQTCHSDNEDGNLLSFFDLVNQKLKWQIEPASGWADAYRFDSNKAHLYLIYNDLGEFAYDYYGNFIDKSSWEKSRIKNANGITLYYIAKDKYSEVIDESVANEIIDLISLAFNRGFQTYTNEKAQAYRLLGEVYEFKGDIKKAVENYEFALKINPKVGIKKRLEKLLKK